MTVVFRVDASAAMGGGHWLRCLVLADALLAQGHRVVWCYAQTTPALLQRLQQRNIPAIALTAAPASEPDANASRRYAEREGADWLVLDGYQFDSGYRDVLTRSATFRLLLIDDLNDSGPLFADAVLNSTIYAAELGYPRQEAGRDIGLLLGPEYVLLSPVYRRQSVPDFSARNRLFVNFGATDAAGLTLPSLRLLAAAGFGGEVCVVTGPAMTGHEEVARVCRRYGFTHRHDLPDLREVLAQSRLALTAAGSTLHELAFMGVPAVFLVVADNQLQSARCHQQHDWCVWHDGRQADGLRDAVNDVMQWWSDDVQLRVRSARSRQLIDGCGAERVVAYLQQPRKQPIARSQE